MGVLKNRVRGERGKWFVRLDTYVFDHLLQAHDIAFGGRRPPA